MKTQKVILVTGASKGFGLEIAKIALAAGDKVIATVRSKVDQLAASLNNNPNLLVVTMDVTNEAQVKAAVAEGLLRFGKIDVVINNAGYGIVTAIEEATDAEVKAQYDTNVFGLLNVLRAALPHLRAQRSGHIINVSSLFGFDAIPGWALYGSTKFAVEGISKGLAVELAPLNIKVTVVEPGLFSTEFLSAESYSASKNIIADYETTVGPMRVGADQLHGNQPGDPKKLAQVVVDIAHNENPPLHLPIGKDAVGMYKANAEKTSKEIDQWIEVSTSTDHDHVAAN
ncbi:NADP-dependent 3-hydroxy acid dehydrogenase YdfG [Mucilaginibacter gossypiicola]|uniref:NADP-dependent 3-hydroxy acid dehydrogenase YdfG n=1 Tax=Mucilaginibacter gossypiicola TaxID=551995 RepID=A0A1H8JTX7_9SPHI|nr:oxidoreductase [Mucilaginibacter gossypiicola]SEN84190.1 NADP-dependent 3-hydroxy acid dehydrogenase YdfG [Mucilaginibacter gossypiicola]